MIMNKIASLNDRRVLVGALSIVAPLLVGPSLYFGMGRDRNVTRNDLKWGLHAKGKEI